MSYRRVDDMVLNSQTGRVAPVILAGEVGHDRVHTSQEVSGLVWLSKERVRQVQKRALTKLRLALKLAFSTATTSPGKTNGAFKDLTTTIPGRFGLGVLTSAECGT